MIDKKSNIPSDFKALEKKSKQTPKQTMCSFQLSASMVERLDMLAEHELLTRSAVLRRLIANALKDAPTMSAKANSNLNEGAVA